MFMIWIFEVTWTSSGADKRALELWGRARGGAIWLKNCQNSLETRLKYACDFTELQIISGGGRGHKICTRFARKFTKHWIFCPLPAPVEKSCIRTCHHFLFQKYLFKISVLSEKMQKYLINRYSMSWKIYIFCKSMQHACAKILEISRLF